MEHTSSDQDGDNMRKSKMLTIPIVDMADPAAAAVISKVLFVVLGLRCLLDCHVLKGFGIYMIGILDRLY